MLLSSCACTTKKTFKYISRNLLPFSTNSDHTHTDRCQCKHTDVHTQLRTSFCLFTYGSYEYINCCSPTLGAGDVVAAALPNLKCLKKITGGEMNPVPVLQTVGLCGKLQEVSVWYPKHCEVGMRCAYRFSKIAWYIYVHDIVEAHCCVIRERKAF